jgi:sugar lactone lactonase YvrE
MRVQVCVQACVIALAGLLVTACGSDPEPEPAGDAPAVEAAPAAPMLPDVIVAERGGFIPEGVEYDMDNGRLLTGSLSEGSVFQLHEDGRVTPLVSDPDLVSSVGIEADELRDRLLVANSDRSVFQGETRGQAMLGVYNLTTGERIAMVDLAATVEDAGDDAAFFANDVAVADDGTAYVTDTRMNLVYRVDTDYQASVFHRFDDDGSGPNGIVEHPAGYLLVARGAALWKVPLADPASATAVMLPEDIPGQDGLVWSAGRLAIVSNADNRVVALTSGDEWMTADLAGVAAYEPQGTTAAVVGDDVYVVHPHFADDDPPSVSRVEFQ